MAMNRWRVAVLVAILFALCFDCDASSHRRRRLRRDRLRKPSSEVVATTSTDQSKYTQPFTDAESEKAESEKSEDELVEQLDKLIGPAIVKRTVRVTQLYSLDHPEGIPKSLLVSNPIGRFEKLIDGVDAPAVWVFPGPVSDLTAFGRVMTGLPQRLGAIEVSVPEDALLKPGGLKFALFKWQRIIDPKVAKDATDPEHHKLEEIPFATMAEHVNRTPECVKQLMLTLGKLDITDFVDWSSSKEKMRRVLARVWAGGVNIELPVVAVGNTLFVCIPKYRIRKESAQVAPYIEEREPESVVAELPRQAKRDPSFIWVLVWLLAAALFGIFKWAARDFGQADLAATPDRRQGSDRGG
jgi:hypothetical protein